MSDQTIAYFSMEIALETHIPTYSGGLGVLAGDTLRSAADLSLPMVAVTLVHRKGYFAQRIDSTGAQIERPSPWSPEDHLEPLAPRVIVVLEGRKVCVRAWRYIVEGVGGAEVPVYLLDTNLPENSPKDRELTDVLYGGDARLRLKQEAVLGLGGEALLRALGHGSLKVYHMNEGHSALLVLALLERQAGLKGLPSVTAQGRAAVRQQCVFTTHTPVSAGHDRFPMKLVGEVLGPVYAKVLQACPGMERDTLNMTTLALGHARATNGVAMRHGQVSREMFPGQLIDAITNGVHAQTWLSEPMQELLDHHIPEWRADPMNLRYAVGILPREIAHAHEQSKRRLIAEVEWRTGRRLDPAAMTIGFARRATGYKRMALLFSDMPRLKRIAREVGPLQIIYAGKAHPHDKEGKTDIREVNAAARALEGVIPVVYLQDYDMDLARRLCAGVDLWLNTPLRPLEASGTSGMKAALNGVPSLSTLDGWWIEGHVEGATGWSIGEHYQEMDPAGDAEALYSKLESAILPMFYHRPEEYARVRQLAVAYNGSFFNAQRMVLQYVRHVYRLQYIQGAVEDGAGPAQHARPRSWLPHVREA